MSYSIKGTEITLTRGDTLRALITIYDSEGNPFTPSEGDEIRFAAKRNYSSSEVVINKEIPINTLLLQLDPEDTKPLSFKPYVYDIQYTHSNGDIDTFIKGILNITEEVE